MTTVQVAYIGAKPLKQDNVANTGTTWLGPGDVQPVPINAWPLLARHPDVWRLEGEAQGLGKQAQATAPVASPVPPPAPTPTPTPAPAQPHQSVGGSEIGIYGTNHPEQIQVGEQLLQLEDVIAAAQAGSGLNVDDWNTLEDGDRFDFVEAHIATLRAEDASRRSTAVATTVVATLPTATPSASEPATKTGRRKATADSTQPAPGKRGKRGG